MSFSILYNRNYYYTNFEKKKTNHLIEFFEFISNKIACVNPTMLDKSLFYFSPIKGFPNQIPYQFYKILGTHYNYRMTDFQWSQVNRKMFFQKMVSNELIIDSKININYYQLISFHSYHKIKQLLQQYNITDDQHLMIQNYKSLRNYKGLRHIYQLPVRGQRTKSNAIKKRAYVV